MAKIPARPLARPLTRPYGVIAACRLGMFVQALVINLTPLLFIPLRDQLGLTWEQLGRLVLINFTTQLLVDLVAGALVARVGLRAVLVAAHGLAAAGLGVFALAPVTATMATTPFAAYPLLVAGTVVFSAGCGLLEVFLSPVLSAVPSRRQAGDMALLHAFYPLGKLVVVLGTAASLALAGPTRWPWIAAGWTIVPLVGAWIFSRVELPALVAEGERQRVRHLARQPLFLAVLLAMALAGASELAISQWTSAYAQRGLGLSPMQGNVIGFGLFAVGMIIGRVWYGLRGEGRDLPRLLLRSALASIVAYLLAALSPWTTPAFLACCCSGLAVGMLWPATLSLAVSRWPLAGATVFAALAAAGDAGGAIAAWLVGMIADLAQATPALATWLPGAGAETRSLRAGLLVGALAPLGMAAVAWWMIRAVRTGAPPDR